VDIISRLIKDVLGVEVKLEKKVDNNLTEKLVELLLDLRQQARKDKNWGLSDQIRDGLDELGIQIKDGKDKSTWTIKS
jgi:cysteinyl-tRNA synthetase